MTNINKILVKKRLIQATASKRECLVSHVEEVKNILQMIIKKRIPSIFDENRDLYEWSQHYEVLLNKGVDHSAIDQMEGIITGRNISKLFPKDH